MRFFSFLMLLCACTASHAGTLEECQQQEKSKDAIFSCVEAKRVHSVNQLREASDITLNAVNEKIQQTGHKNLLSTYRSMQAHHVRERTTKCSKQETVIEQKACEADMNDTQISQLAKLIE